MSIFPLLRVIFIISFDCRVDFPRTYLQLVQYFGYPYRGTQITNHLGTGVFKTWGYPYHCDNGPHVR